MPAGCYRATRKSLPEVLEGPPVRLRPWLGAMPRTRVQKSILEDVRADKNYREKIADF